MADRMARVDPHLHSMAGYLHKVTIHLQLSFTKPANLYWYMLIIIQSTLLIHLLLMHNFILCSTVKPCFHLYVYVYVSHQDRLDDMKCFHSCIWVSVIHLNHYYERFKWMMSPTSGLGYGGAQLMMYISNTMQYAYTMQLRTNRNMALISSCVKVYLVHWGKR